MLHTTRACYQHDADVRCRVQYYIRNITLTSKCTHLMSCDQEMQHTYRIDRWVIWCLYQSTLPSFIQLQELSLISSSDKAVSLLFFKRGSILIVVDAQSSILKTITVLRRTFQYSFKAFRKACKSTEGVWNSSIAPSISL